MIQFLKLAAKLGLNQNTLSTWVTHYHKSQNKDDNYFSFAQQAKLKKLEKQLKDLKEESELSRSLFLQYVVPHVASLFLFSVMCATYLVGAWRYLLSNICLSCTLHDGVLTYRTYLRSGSVNIELLDRSLSRLSKRWYGSGSIWGLVVFKPKRIALRIPSEPRLSFLKTKDTSQQFDQLVVELLATHALLNQSSLPHNKAATLQK